MERRDTRYSLSSQKIGWENGSASILLSRVQLLPLSHDNIQNVLLPAQLLCRFRHDLVHNLRKQLYESLGVCPDLGDEICLCILMLEGITRGRIRFAVPSELCCFVQMATHRRDIFEVDVERRLLSIGDPKLYQTGQTNQLPHLAYRLPEPFH